MVNRQYASFLLRFWTVVDDEAQAETAYQEVQSTVLHLQHLQTGLTWQFSNLEELNKLLNHLAQAGTLDTQPKNIKARL